MLRLIALLLLLILFVALLQAGGALLRAVALALLSFVVAILAGLFVGRFAGFEVGLGAGLLLLPFALWSLQRLYRRHEERALRRWREDVLARGNPDAPAPASPPPPAPRLAGDPEVEAALARLEPHLDWAASRLAVVRSSFARFVHRARAAPDDMELLDWSAVIRNQVPGLAEDALAEHAAASPSERRQLLEDLMDSLEQLAAEADRLLAARRRQGLSRFALRRRHIAARTRRPDLDG